MTTTDTPRVWIGCLACYGAGHLVGEWFDATTCPTDMTKYNAEPSMRPGGILPEPLRSHYAEGHEELWVMDHEGFAGLLTGECSPAWVDNGSGDLGDWRDGFADAYAGQWESEQDYARNFAEDIGAIDDEARWPAHCIDWEWATRELFYDYWSTPAPDGGVYVFRSV